MTETQGAMHCWFTWAIHTFLPCTIHSLACSFRFSMNCPYDFDQSASLQHLDICGFHTFMLQTK